VVSRAVHKWARPFSSETFHLLALREPIASLTSSVVMTALAIIWKFVMAAA